MGNGGAVTAKRRVGAVKDGRVARRLDVQPPFPVRKVAIVAARLELGLVGVEEEAMPREEGTLMTALLVVCAQEKLGEMTYRQVNGRGLPHVYVDKVIVQCLGPGRLTGREQTGLLLDALDSGNEVPALGLGEGSPVVARVSIGPEDAKNQHIPFLSDLEVEWVALSLEVAK